MPVSAQIRESWDALNRAAMQDGGQVISVKYDFPATLIVRPGSLLPGSLTAEGYGVTRDADRQWLDAAAASEVMTHTVSGKEHVLRTLQHAGHVMREQYAVMPPKDAVSAPQWEVLPALYPFEVRRKRRR